MKLNKNNYPRNDEGQPDAAALYLKRFKARGLKMKGKKHQSDSAWNAWATRMGIQTSDHAFRSKPNHAARFHDINEVFPPLFKPKETSNAITE